MTRLAVTFTLVALFAASASIVLDAQRGREGLGGRAGGAGGVRPGNGGGRGSRGGGSVNVPSAPAALPSINRPSLPIDGLNRPGFPLSGPLGFGPPQTAPFDAQRGTFTQLHRSRMFGYGYGAPVYGPSYAPESTYDTYYRRTSPESAITTGTLFLDVTPATALVFVDTAYVGSVEDLQTRGVTLPPGHHWVDLEAPGYDKKTIEITIRPGEPLRYRFDMTPARSAAITVIPPRSPETMYAIPGCYGGNRPPVLANLPKGCDIAKVRVIRPQPRTN